MTDTWELEQQRLHNLASFRRQQDPAPRRAPRPVFTFDQLPIAERVAQQAQAREQEAA